MNLKTNPGQYESIQHFGNGAAKVNLVCIRSSAWHWHYDYELIAVLKGRIEVFYSVYGTEAQILSAGDMILVNPKAMHSLRGIDLDNNCLFIQFSPELFEPVPAGMIYHFYFNSCCADYPPVFSYDHYRKLVSQIGIAYRNNLVDSGLRRKATLYLLLADLLVGAQYELHSSHSNTEKDMETVMAISTYIDSNLLQENLSESVCRQFGLSDKGIYLLLKQMIGISLKEMIDTARIERACVLLQDNNNTLQIISDMCGYSGEATFYRRFKAAMGITPGEYRKGAEISAASHEIQDYLSFDETGADLLLRHWAEAEDAVR